MVHVFISHVHENRHTVDRLALELENHGVPVWTDRGDAPATSWESAIESAIRTGSLFLACFSKEYNERGPTFMNVELQLAIRELRVRPWNKPWFIPLLLNEGASVPDTSISRSETLKDIHEIDLNEDWDGGIERIVHVYKKYHLLGAVDTERPSLRIFLCHASEDKDAVRMLYRRLLQSGFVPWLDEENLLPGQDWAAEITKAIQASDAVLVCLSQRSEKRGYVQKEIVRALDVADEQPEGTIFLIPVRLEDCRVPERLRRWQWVNLFHDNGFERLQASLKTIVPCHNS